MFVCVATLSVHIHAFGAALSKYKLEMTILLCLPPFLIMKPQTLLEKHVQFFLQVFFEVSLLEDGPLVSWKHVKY